MKFFYIVFGVSWVIWFIFSDKSKWKIILPSCILAGFLGSTSDSIMDWYKLWEYFPNGILSDMFNDWGIFPVVTYLFLQKIPNNYLFWYYVKWTILAIIIEWFHVYTGHMVYYKWWNGWCSYISDWLLFFAFHMTYKIFYNYRK